MQSEIYEVSVCDTIMLCSPEDNTLSLAVSYKLCPVLTAPTQHVELELDPSGQIQPKQRVRVKKDVRAYLCSYVLASMHFICLASLFIANLIPGKLKRNTTCIEHLTSHFHFNIPCNNVTD